MTTQSTVLKDATPANTITLENTDGVFSVKKGEGSTSNLLVVDSTGITTGLKDGSVTLAKLGSGFAKILQVVTQSDAGSSTTATSYTNLSTSTVPIIPLSDDSTIIVLCSGSGVITAGGSATNSLATYRLYDGSTQFGSIVTIGVSSGAGANLQASGAISLIGVYANTSLATKSFTIQGYKTGGTSTASATALWFIVVEVQN